MPEVITLDDTPPPSPPPTRHLSPARGRKRLRPASSSASLAERRLERIEAAFARHSEENSRNESLVISHSPRLPPLPDPLSCIRQNYNASQIRSHVGPKHLITFEHADEKIGVLLYSPEEFLYFVRANTLEEELNAMKRYWLHPLLVLLEGIDAVLERQNRRFVDDVTRHGVSRTAVTSVFSRKALQDLYAHLYMTLQIRCIITYSQRETADRLSNIADMVGKERKVDRTSDWLQAQLQYRRKRTGTHVTAVVDTEKVGECDISTTNFRMERSGDDGFSYMAMLQVIPGVSAEKARAVREVYPSLNALFAAYDVCESWNEKERLLQDIVWGARRRVGPSVSASIAKVMASDDPSVCINM